MARAPRVRWRIVGTSNANATTIKTAIDSALAGKALTRTVTANTRNGTRVNGDYIFTIDTAANAVYAVLATQLASAAAVSGNIVNELCDHQPGETSTGEGCVLVNASSKGEG
jgi:hypothetical protein